MDSNNNNDMGNVMRDQGYYVPAPSVPSPMLSGDNISSIPIPVGMSSSSDMDNDVLSREGSRSIPSLVEGIKKSVETSYHDDVKARNSLFQMINEVGIPKGNYDITGSRINLRDSRYRLSTGEWIPKYENYINNIDNDDRLSRSQSGWEKTYRGLGKFIYKSALYGIGGVGQSVYGLKELVTKGMLSAMYDNSFVRWLDDMDKRGDYTLNHYYSKEERDAGFLKSMFTTNFWTNDLLSGAAFTAGAILSSYAFAVAGLMNAARMGARIGATVAGLGRAAFATKSGFNSMLRAARVGRGIGKGLDNLTFIGASTLWEASVESRSGLMESEENFKQAYRNAYGREASYEELMRFRNDNVDAANTIFAANIGILTLSNIVMFGDMFGMDLGVDKFIKRNIFGVRVERMDNGMLRAITPKKWQKVAGNTFNIIKRPVSEGLYEEGLQGVASKSAEDWVESRYNPMAIRQNIGYMEAIKNGFKEAYGSNQGWKEIGIGMIIGSVMGGKTFGGIKEWSQDMSWNKGMVEAYNTNAGALTTAAVRAIRGSMALNAQLSGVDTSYESDGRIINKDFSDAVFNRLRYDSEMGMLDDTKENFRTVVESIPNSDIASDMNMTDEQVNEYKADLVNEFNKKVNNFIMANRFADSLTEGISNRSFNTYISNMVYNGLEAKDNLDDIASQLNRLYKNDIGEALDVYSHLNPDSYKAISELMELTSRMQALEKGILRLQRMAMGEERFERNKDKLAKKTDELAKLTEDKIVLERKLATMVNSEVDLSSLLFSDRSNRQISASDLMAAYNTITDLENVVSIRGVDNHKEAMALLSEYRHNLVAYKNINESLRRMRDKRFIRSQERGFMKILSNAWGKTYEEDDSKYDFRNTDNSDANALYANDQAIDKAFNDGLIGEDEAFMFKTYNHMIARSMETDIQSGDNIVENVPDDEDLLNPSDDRSTDIAIKIWNGNEDILSPRERQIYDNNKDRIDDIIKGLGIILSPDSIRSGR